MKEISINDRITKLCKAPIHHKNTNTFTDMGDDALSRIANKDIFQEILEKELLPLKEGISILIPLEGENFLKMYKVEEGIYSGHLIEPDGTIFHHIDRATIPEISSHLIAKGSPPKIPDVVEDIIEEAQEIPVHIPEAIQEENKDGKITININISKSKENIMKSLEERINFLCKSDDIEEDIEVDEQENDDIEIEQEEDLGRTTLINDMIKLLADHNKTGQSKNVSDISKFLVHLHKEEGSGEEEDVNKSSNSKVKEIVKEVSKMEKGLEYKIFSEGKPSLSVLNSLEKGNNFFKSEIQSPKLAVEFYEKDYASMSKARIEKHTDKMIKSNLDLKFRK